MAVHGVMCRRTRHRRGRGGRRWLRAIVATATVVALTGCDDGGSDVTDAGDTVQVDLLSTTDTLRGHEWPTRQDGTLSEAAAVERPVAVEVRVGEDRVFEAPSQLTFFEQRRGEIMSVELQPPAELASLPATIDEVEALLAANDALEEELADALESWRSQQETEEPEWPSSGDHLAAGAELEPGVELEVGLRQRGDEGWFYTVSLFRPVETWPVSG